MKFVLDTNVIVAAMRSPTGASAALLKAARRNQIVIVANVALALEYEATCSRAEHILASGLSAAQVGIFLDAVIAMAEPVETHFLWRPQLRDPADELVLEAKPIHLEQVKELVKREMIHAMELKVPIDVDVSSGPNWLETK